MKASLYQYRDYKELLIDLLASHPQGSRGRKKALAEFIGCQVSHISNVLAGEAHLSPEQAEATARFCGLTAEETEFFLILVQYTRAGTMALKKFSEKLLIEKQTKAANLKGRLKIPEALKSQYEARYYSAWYYGAIHVLLSIPEYQTREALSRKVSLPLEKVSEVLEFLELAGLCEKHSGKYKITKTQIHMDKSSPLISKHHTNWRMKTIQAIEAGSPDQRIHYSSVVTLSQADFIKVSEIFEKSLQQSIGVIKDSPEEEMAVICMDFYRL